MLEAEVHSELLNFLRQKNMSSWVHHLTMARMVARGLRLGRSAIIQTSTNHPQYYLSYLTSALLSNKSVIIVTSPLIQEQLLQEEIPQLQKCLNNHKIIQAQLTKDLRSQNQIVVTTYQVWLEDNFSFGCSHDIPTIIVECQLLPDIISDYLTQELTQQDCLQLQLINPLNQDLIRENIAKLTKSIFAHPVNPYNSYLLSDDEKIIIQQLSELTDRQNNPYSQKLAVISQYISNQTQYFNYVQVNRQKGTFSIKSSPLNFKDKVTHLWQNQPLILIANYLAPEKEVVDYSNALGINPNNFTCLKFLPHAQNQNLHLYLPDNLPLPNHPQFQVKVIQEILALIGAIKVNHSLIIILVDDVPLQSQITTILAAQFGSRVKLNKINLTEHNILVCDSKFWLEYQLKLPKSQFLVMTTLPIPSLENPLIAAQVAYYKSQKKDWFRLFLLPMALKTIQQLTTSIRENQGVVALLDNRVNLRSYGRDIFQVLEPYDRVNYLDLSWLNLI
jgi:ATP-dependent DNA helicase DinG